MENSKNSGTAFEEQFYFRQEQIYSHLKLLNEVLQKLDEEVVEYANLTNTRTLGEKLVSQVTGKRQEWPQKIRDEMKLFHHYQNYSLKALCQEYCSYTTCCKNCYQTCCNGPT